MLNAIVNNAFRILGTPANVKIKEYLANVSKIKAYTRVKKDVSFPLDFSKILKKPQRDLDIVQKSVSNLSKPREFLKNSLFWIYSITPEQQEAAVFLEKGDFKSAEKIYKQRSDFSSLISYSTILFLQKRGNQAIRVLNDVIDKPEIKNEFIEYTSQLLGHQIQLSDDELAEIVFDALLEEYRPIDLLKIYDSFLKSEKKKKVKDFIEKKNIEKLVKEIEQSKKSMEKLIDNNISAAFENLPAFYEKNKTNLRYLEKSVGSDSNELKKSADSIGECMLDCISEYVRYDYNHRDVAKVISMLKKVRNMVYSQVIIERLDSLLVFSEDYDLMDDY